MTEREMFLEWHYKQFKQLSCDGLSDEDSKNLYERVYSHNHQDLIRTMEFNAWLSSASREGYKLVPVNPTKEIIDAMEQFMDYDHADMESAYKAIIEVVDE